MFFTAYFTSEFKDYIDPFEFFVGMISGLAHDINHKGVNNLYKVKKQSENSIRYVEQAVLENMHVSTFFSIILRNPKFDIISKFKDNIRAAKFKKLVVSSIISTDMGRHAQFIEELKTKIQALNKLKQNPLNNDPLVQFQAFNNQKESDREFLTNVMVHACDIGNPCYSFDNYMNWCYLLSQEFHDQTIKEEQKGVPITTFLQYTGKLAFKRGQIFFSSTLLLPLWKELGILIPKLQVLPEQLNKNIKTIEEDLKRNK